MSDPDRNRDDLKPGAPAPTEAKDDAREARVEEDPGQGEARDREAGKGAEPETTQGAAEAKVELRQKVGLVVALSLVSFAALVGGGWVVHEIEQPREVEVSWDASEGVSLDPDGPVSFRHDRAGERLIYRGAMDESTKRRLLELFPEEAEVEAGSKPQLPENRRSYQAAIGRLAFESARSLETPLLWVLLLGAIGGVLGVQLRSISNFIGVVCVKDDFDFRRWWPWYVLRPVLGLFVGVLVVVLTKTDLLAPDTESSTNGNLWWLALAVLAGFGAEDFMLRLRLISHTLFGVSELGQDKEEKPKRGSKDTKPDKPDDGASEPADGNGKAGPEPSGKGDERGTGGKEAEEEAGEGSEEEPTTSQLI